jgi:hypothetical protein
MARRAPAIGWLILPAVLVLACATAPSTVPSAAMPAASDAPAELGPEKQATARFDDLLVTLTIEHDRAPAGERIRAHVDIRNLGFGPVSWQSGGCELSQGFTLEGPEVPQPPPGRAWEGTAHWAKWAATTSGVGPVGFIPPNVAEMGPPWNFGCTMELRVDDIGPGQTASVDAVWVGFASDGQPAPAGAYSLSYTFPYLGRVAKEVFSGDPIADAKPIQASVDFQIDGRAGVAVPSTLAFDAALADPRVAAWISGIRREQLYGASVILKDGLWQIRIEIEMGAAEIAVNASSGAVVSLNLP